MKIQIEKAKAFEIDITKPHFITFESEEPMPMAKAVGIKKALRKSFENLGVENVEVVVSVKGKVLVSEIKK